VLTTRPTWSCGSAEEALGVLRRCWEC